MTIQFDKDGYATSSGTVTIFNVTPDTRECFGAIDEFINAGQGLPADAYLDAPPKVKKGFVICRTADGTEWEYVVDHRGETRYSTVTGVSFIVSEIGDYPAKTTDIAPTTEFDQWDGKLWVTDTEAQYIADVKNATDKKSELIGEASVVIAPLADANAGGYIDECDIPILSEWQRYRYALTKVDVSKAPDIEWPLTPN